MKRLRGSSRTEHLGMHLGKNNEKRDKQVTRCKTEGKKVVWKPLGTVAHVRSKFARGISIVFYKLRYSRE